MGDKKLFSFFFIIITFCLLLVNNNFNTNQNNYVSNNSLSNVNIANGVDAKPDDMPWFASINLEKAYWNPNTQKLDGTRMSYGMCCGTLIAPSWVLTASHVCALVSYKRKISVSFFYTNKPTMNQSKNMGIPLCFDPPNNSLPGNKKAFTVNVDKRIQFDSNDNFNSVLSVPGHDVALLHLEHPVTNIKPISVLKSFPKVGNSLSYCGWGYKYDNPQVYTTKLQKGITHRDPDDTWDNLKKKLGTPSVTTPLDNRYEYTIAGNNSTESHAYPGDSGSGLIEYINGKPYVCGIISRSLVDDNDRVKYFGITCVECPGCDRFYSFIMNNIKNNSIIAIVITSVVGSLVFLSGSGYLGFKIYKKIRKTKVT